MKKETQSPSRRRATITVTIHYNNNIKTYNIKENAEGSLLCFYFGTVCYSTMMVSSTGAWCLYLSTLKRLERVNLIMSVNRVKLQLRSCNVSQCCEILLLKMLFWVFYVKINKQTKCIYCSRAGNYKLHVRRWTVCRTVDDVKLDVEQVEWWFWNESHQFWSQGSTGSNC